MCLEGRGQEPTISHLSFPGSGKTSYKHFHIRAVHLDIIKVLYSPTNAQVIVLTTILKFTLK
jgi:hypothetical protein